MIFDNTFPEDARAHAAVCVIYSTARVFFKSFGAVPPGGFVTFLPLTETVVGGPSWAASFDGSAGTL